VTCIMCNEARFDEADKQKPINERHTSGGPTDSAILKVIWSGWGPSFGAESKSDIYESFCFTDCICCARISLLS